MERPDVEKYEAMAEAATVGPWSMNNVGGTVWPGHCAVRGPIGAEYQGAYLREGDAALIAAARTAIPELCAYIKHLEAAPATVWAVVYSNYDPAEVDSLWVSQALAEKQADTLGDDWRVVAWKVRAEEAVK